MVFGLWGSIGSGEEDGEEKKMSERGVEEGGGERSRNWDEKYHSFS